jgi:TolB-like protein/class 3 adenylate cyclase/Flp pilus assembly protein TadD
MPGERSKVLTLVFTDLADSTALKTEHGDHAVGELIERHRGHVTQLADRCAGRVIDWAGDGCFLTFDTSSAAVTFGLKLQQVHHYETELPGVRVGVHMGEVTERPFDGTVRIEGLAVDLSARVGGLARPGQVLLSAPVEQNAKQRLSIHEFGQPVQWKTYGPYMLKGFDEPIDVREAGLQDVSPFTPPEATEKAWPAGQDHSSAGSVSDAAPIRKLAVLPLANLSGDPNQEYFAIGMTEAIITELAKISALRVISRTSVMRYQNTKQPLTEIARELNVDGLVEGSVLRAGNDVRITAQFIRGDSDEHLWAEHYDGTVDTIMKLQKDVALAIADEIEVAVSASERAELKSAPKIDPDAYDLYLKSSQFGGDWSAKSFRIGLDRSVKLQTKAPDFGRMYTLESSARYMMGMYGYARSPETFAASRKAARTAIRLDSGDDGAETSLAWLAMSYEWDWEESYHRFQSAIRLNSSNQFSLGGCSILLAILGRYDEAISYAARAIDVDPNNPPAYHYLGWVRYLTGDFSGAIEQLTRSIEIGGNALPPRMDIAQIAVCAGDHALAIRRIDEALSIGGPEPHALAYKAVAVARAGETGEAEQLLQSLEDYRGESYVQQSDLALIHLALGRRDVALDAIERAHMAREYYALFLPCAPVYDVLRDEPRFQAMVDAMALPNADKPL